MNLYKITIVLLFSFIFNLNSFAQDKLNQYGYILIPKQLDIQKKPNQYNINTILKDYLNKYNFTAFVQGDTIPQHIKPCDMLNVNADKSGFLSTKTTITFTDCYGNNIYTSIEGVSRIKEFKPAYYEALREALKDPNIQEHQFTVSTANTENIPIKTIKLERYPITNKIAFSLEFKETVYTFKNTKIKDVFVVFKENQEIGTLKKQNDLYILTTKNLNGTGTFDDYGNFTLTRINPINKAEITDIMARVN
ncbi:hypothetical protein [Wenyingzhuangia sp. IMCC45467]